MSERHPEISVDERRITEAAGWKVRLNEAGVESSYEFEAWLAADPANEIAWKQVEAPWDLFGEQASSPLAVKLRRDALNRVHLRPPLYRRPWFAIAASIVLVVFTGLSFLRSWSWAEQPTVYQTAHGERRSVLLADGSHVSLDAETELRVMLSAGKRDLELVQGQARFDVAHDVRRPFSVLAGGQSVVAVGTAFNIDLSEKRPRITMIEGKVEVFDASQASSGQAPRRLTALIHGQQLSFTAQSAIVRPANVEAATAWNNGQLIFDDEALATVVSRVSRYSTKPITVAPDVATLKVSGVFQSNDVDGFVETIGGYLPVRTVKSASGAITLVAKD